MKTNKLNMKTTRRKYFTGTKKLKHVKLFENFLNEDEEISLEAAVFQALDNAIENEYDEVNTDDLETVAKDLIGLDSEIEKMDPEIKDVAAIVKQWRELKCKTTMYNLDASALKKLHKFGAVVIQDVENSTVHDKHYEVFFNKEIGKNIIEWLKIVDKNVPLNDLKGLFPELFKFVNESLNEDETIVWFEGKDLHTIKPGTNVKISGPAEYTGKVKKCKDKDCVQVELDKRYHNIQNNFGEEFTINDGTIQLKGSLETYDSYKK